jgi:hypothetical protein
VIFTHTIEAGKTKPGDVVTAKTTQVVLLPDGQTLPSATVLTGHVVESSSFVSDSTPYAAQKPSVLSVHFDKISGKSWTIPVNLEVRAISGPVQSHEAEILHFTDESDTTGTRVLIGGGTFSPLNSTVVSPNGDIVGYIRKQGVFAKLMARESVGGSSTFRCETTITEQSVGIFSANACGAYGLDAISISDNGGTGSGTVVLESRHQSVKLYAGSEALLQVVGAEQRP